MQDKFIVTVGKMEFKEVAEKDSINPFRPGIPIESFMGLDIDLVKSNGSRPYRVWWSRDWISTYPSISDCKDAILRRILEKDAESL